MGLVKVKPKWVKRSETVVVMAVVFFEMIQHIRDNDCIFTRHVTW